VDAYEYYKRVIWFSLLDYMLVELESRFGHHCKFVLRMSALIASKCVIMDFSELSDCIDVYGSFFHGDIHLKFDDIIDQYDCNATQPSTPI